jgi:hypothetical protein
MNSVQFYSNIVIVYSKEHKRVKHKYYDFLTVTESGLGLLPVKQLLSGILGQGSLQILIARINK